MNFPKIEKSKELLDNVITNVRKMKDFQKNEFSHKYVSAYQIAITDRLNRINNKLPDYEIKNEYYQMMFKNICPKSTMEKYKNHIASTVTVINKISEKYKKLFLKMQSRRSSKFDKEKFVRIKKEYVGRIASIVKNLDSTFSKLLDLEKEFSRIASPDFNLRTIVLVGIPNAGKTTYLTKITEATPEINSYEFTTKALNIGFFKRRQDIYQVIDTPGLIHTEFKEMNAIEKQAIAAIKAISDLVVFVYNPTLDKEKQIAMLKTIKENNPEKKVVVSSTYTKNQEMEGQENISIKELLETYPVEKKKKSRWS
ncbi:MAG TPA: 50S ribosome-binding GTPase [Candidatus Diapherotrites archaeon]|jgi:small GTP-binding protein|nr:50S ribosome-binding GTPase [Candidatus Diapherotrites archaeon]